METSALLSDLSRRAETLGERLAQLMREVPPSRPEDYRPEAGGLPAETRQLLAPWCKAFSRGRLDALLRRLAWDGWSPETAAAAFRRSGPPADSDSPAPWTAELERYAEAARALAAELAEGDNPRLKRWRQRVGEIPFLELWVPWVETATDGLAESEPEADFAGLGKAAMDDLEGHLLREIAGLSELAAMELFDDFRPREAKERYRSFVTACLGDPLARLYAAFPALGRQTAETLRQWRGEVAELARRFNRDRQRITEVFAGGVSPGGVRAVHTSLSDRHGDGRRVLLLELESGLRLIYKPRSVALELALKHWFSWCEQEGFELSPRAPRVLAGDGYGWVEFVAQDRLTGRHEAELYYRRAGALVAFAYALRARDLHGENLVASRRGPVVVDAEMFLQPVRVRLSADPEATKLGVTSAGGSCLESGLLLEPGLGDRNQRREWGGLRPEPQRRGPASAGRRWQNVNRDDMAFEPCEVPGRLGENVLWVDDAPTGPERYRRELADGFEQAYRFLLDRKPALLANDGPLELLRSTRPRILLRPSSVYARLLALMALPRNQRSGLSPSLLYEASLAPFADLEERPRLWPLVADERASLLARDIPRFEVAAEATVLESGAGEQVADYLEVSGLQAVHDRIAALDLEDLERQLGQLRQALEPPDRLAFWSHRSADAVAAADLEPAELARECRAVARALAEDLLLRDLDGLLPATSWAIDRGRTGVALLYAALARHDGDTRSAALAHRLLEPVRQGFGVEEARAPKLGLGGFSGLGSVVYALTWLSRLLDDPSLVELARQGVRRISQRRIREDRVLDLEGGAAGCLLGLLALHQATGEESVLDLARACGDHLLAHQKVLASGGAAWCNSGGLALAGWAHGAAGIARALAALAKLDGGERYLVGAAAALGYERTLYDRERGNWPVLTGTAGGERGERLWRVAWCHGAPGVAISRLMLPARLHDRDLAAELDAALATTAAAPAATIDHLCCGSLGRSAVLLSAGRRLDRDDCRIAARTLTAAVLDRAAADGHFTLSQDRLGNRGLPAGFLKGLAGIAYHLLRLSGASGLPDVLALELPNETAALPETSE